MTYNVFGWTLSLTQSINHSATLVKWLGYVTPRYQQRQGTETSIPDKLYELHDGCCPDSYCLLVNSYRK